MKVLYDYQIFDMQVTGGISRYHADLYRECLENDILSEIAIKYSDNIYLKDLNLKLNRRFSSEEHFLGGISFKGKNILYRIGKKMGMNILDSEQYNALYCREIIQKYNYDIFHPTYYKDLYADIDIKRPVILTIHDMIYESYPHFMDGLDTIINKRKWASKSNAIIAISEYTKEEILKYYDFLKESDVHVVYHGIDLDNLSSYPIVTEKEKFILFVGDRWEYKDFYTLLRAVKIVKKLYPEIKLCCVGRPFSQKELLYINFLGLYENVENRGRVSDEELIELYRKTFIYISTSLSEGFGLPLLESMKYGAPMLLSDIKVYREIAKDAAMYYAPTDENNLAESILELYNNSNIPFDLISRGRNRILLFDKKQMICNSLKVYKSI